MPAIGCLNCWNVIDTWAQHDFGARPAEVIAHIEACSSKLTGLVQTIYEAQMLDTWRQLASMFLRLDPPGSTTKPLPPELTTAYERLKLLLKHIPVFQQDFIQFEAALIAYAVLAEDSPQSAERLACDEYVFQRIEQQIDTLYALYARQASSNLQAHLQLCCETLKPLASDFQLQARLDAWAQMAQLEAAQPDI